MGGVKDIRADVRILASTNRDLKQAMASGSIREDLYYRLNVASLQLPPLRERSGDIAPLVRYFADRFCTEMKTPRLEIEGEALRLLSSFSWPGNVRELSNTIERAVVLAHGPVVSVADLPDSIGRRPDRIGSNTSQERADFDETMTVSYTHLRAHET